MVILVARKRREAPASDWLATYSDMVTLLLTFFIMLFTMSSIQEEKWQILIKAFTNYTGDTSQVILSPSGSGSSMGQNQGEGNVVPPGSGAPATTDQLPENFDQLYEYIQTAVKENNLESSIEIAKGENSVFIRFSDNIFFEPNSAALKFGAANILSPLGNAFVALEDQIQEIRINGHTAEVAGAGISDRILSTDRANSVLMYFEDTKKVSPPLLVASGYGKNYPIASNNTEEGRKKNRRVDILILSKGIGSDQLLSLIKGDYTVNNYPDAVNNTIITPPPEGAAGEDNAT